jgi:hypothetical protein
MGAVVVDLMPQLRERGLQVLFEEKSAWSAPIAIRMGTDDNTFSQDEQEIRRLGDG